LSASLACGVLAQATSPQEVEGLGDPPGYILSAAQPLAAEFQRRVAPGGGLQSAGLGFLDAGAPQFGEFGTAEAKAQHFGFGKGLRADCELQRTKQ
jgi:hypothetical protein